MAQSGNQPSSKFSLEREQFSFHVLLVYNEYSWSTLGSRPLRFKTRTQTIIDSTGKEFEHPLYYPIWQLVTQYDKVDVRQATSVKAPVNKATGRFDWNTNTRTEEAQLWVRVVGINSSPEAEEQIEVMVAEPRRLHSYLQGVYLAIRSDLKVKMSLDSYPDWANVVSVVEKKFVEAGCDLSTAYRACMEPGMITTARQSD